RADPPDRVEDDGQAAAPQPFAVASGLPRVSAAANEGKALEVHVDGTDFLRIPVRTRVIMPGDTIDEVIRTYAVDQVQSGDILFVTEKIVAIMQGRSYMMSEIKPRRLATFLSRYVTKTSYGIGLGIPETMEFALR